MLGNGKILIRNMPLKQRIDYRNDTVDQYKKKSTDLSKLCMLVLEESNVGFNTNRTFLVPKEWMMSVLIEKIDKKEGQSISFSVPNSGVIINHGGKTVG